MKNENNTLLVIGLGNVGKEYEGTRHNIGFEVADKVSEALDIRFSENKKLQAEVAKKQSLVIAKPTTFMNRSGLSIAKLKDYYKVEMENVIVVSDDFNLELGKVRVRYGGSPGGHNGLESVMSQIGGQFWRVRVGIGDIGDRKAEKFVLEKFNKSEQGEVSEVIDKATSYLVDLMSCGEIKNESINVGPCDK